VVHRPKKKEKKEKGRPAHIFDGGREARRRYEKEKKKEGGKGGKKIWNSWTSSYKKKKKEMEREKGAIPFPPPECWKKKGQKGKGEGKKNYEKFRISLLNSILKAEKKDLGGRKKKGKSEIAPSILPFARR